MGSLKCRVIGTGAPRLAELAHPLARRVVFDDMDRATIRHPDIAAGVHGDVRDVVERRAGAVPEASLADLLQEGPAVIVLDHAVTPRIDDPQIVAIRANAFHVIEVVAVFQVRGFALTKRLHVPKTQPRLPQLHVRGVDAGRACLRAGHGKRLALAPLIFRRDRLLGDRGRCREVRSPIRRVWRGSVLRHHGAGQRQRQAQRKQDECEQTGFH